MPVAGPPSAAGPVEMTGVAPCSGPAPSRGPAPSNGPAPRNGPAPWSPPAPCDGPPGRLALPGCAPGLVSVRLPGDGAVSSTTSCRGVGVLATAAAGGRLE